MIFRSIFHAFSGTPLGATFLRFDVDFLPKSAILEPPLTTDRAPNSTLGATISAKISTFELPGWWPRASWNRPGADLAAQGRPRGAPTAPRLQFYRFGERLGAPMGQNIDRKDVPRLIFPFILMSDWLHCSNVLTSLPKHQTKTFIFRRCSIRLSSPPRPNDDHQR